MKSRSDQVLLARLRLDHHPGLRAFMHQLDRHIDETCYISGESQMTLEHWLISCPGISLISCPGISTECVALFGTHRGRLEWLCEKPLNVVTLVRQLSKTQRVGVYGCHESSSLLFFFFFYLITFSFYHA